MPEVVLDERRVEGERGRMREEGEGRRREKRGVRKTRPEPLAPPVEGGEESTHIATTHEDTTSGAVHCFRCHPCFAHFTVF